MIKKDIKKFCSNPELIENYEEAMKSPIMWHCHHRRETIFTKQDLKEIGEYFHRPPEELIFLTPAQHKKLHLNTCKGGETTKAKIAESHRGKKNYNFGKQFSDDVRKRMSKARKGLLKGRLWWNNGTVCIRAKECPGDGWVRGML